jgi:AraC-like DNA-binding protein
MRLNFNFFNILILTACIQGMILGVLILVKDYRSKSNLFLSILLFAYSLNNLNAVFFDSRLALQIPALLICPFSLILVIGPALYLHTRFTIHPSEKFSKMAYLHFLPVTLELLWYASLSIRFWAQPQAILNFYRRFEDFYSLPEQLAGIVSVFIYLFFTINILKKNKMRLKDTYSSVDGRSQNRLRNLVMMLGLGWLIWLVLIVLDIGWYHFSLDQNVYYPLYLVMAFTIYAIGYSGYFSKQQFEEMAPALFSSKEMVADVMLEQIAQQALGVMEAKQLYLEPDLRLRNLAEAIQTPSNRLSTALKLVLQTNFYDFVNQYRVKAVQEKLRDPSFDLFTLTSIAYDCGFNSKSTFNEAFKKITGITPKEYKKSCKTDVRTNIPDVSKKPGL